MSCGKKRGQLWIVLYLYVTCMLKDLHSSNTSGIHVYTYGLSLYAVVSVCMQRCSARW